ncbi:MAG: primosomal protein N' [Deltaproteobacteria bacterium]|nr:primosomal protein N' [Deltaproteobacteria bacterium]MBI3294719.1 primosomal protein N' [Deltaproteobacteria bacterium]
MIVDIAVPRPVEGSFHYDVPAELVDKVKVGMVIEAPFGKSSTIGFVVGLPQSSSLDPSRIRSISSVLTPEPLFDQTMLEFLTWVSQYYCHPLGEVISAAIPKQSWETAKKSPARKKRELPLEMLAGSAPENLTDAQKEAVAKILDPQDNRPVLLHGVTGSGKTEVYIRCLESMMAEGKGAIVLVPEISLTPLLLARFSVRFPGIVAVWHSHLTPRERREEWEKVRSGQARIVIGARSAVFAPINNLGCIVVDEEHETSFKQEEDLRYHARDMAIVRANRSGAKVILGSATPSVESYHNTTTGKFAYARLATRVQDRPMPKIAIIDLKDEEQKISEVPWLSQTLDIALRKTLADGKQSILYLNRLGFSHMLYCDDCGHTWRCNNCDIGLTYYRQPRVLRCHYCNMRRPVPDTCPECKGHSIETFGFGTEQVEKTIQERFPTARIARMDRSVVKTKRDLEELIERISRRDVDIVIGTQMIAKGHDFPGITLVGILTADANLNIPDFRAHERTFQMLTQVSGRAGRATDPGEVIIQSLQPNHPIIQTILNQTTETFFQTELESRRSHRFPPFSRLALVRFQHKNAARVSSFAQSCVRHLLNEFTRQGIQCSILGPSEAPLARLRNYYRWHCLVKSGGVAELRKAIAVVNAYTQSQKSSVQVTYDIDPMNAM